MLERTNIILAALLTGCAAAPPRAEVNHAEVNHAEVNRAEVNGSRGDRYIYEGDVAIEPVALEAMLEQLLRSGCVRAPSSNLGECVVKVEESPSRRRLVIYPQGEAGCFGPCSFWVDERQLHARKDLQGERDDGKFKEAVRADVSKLGGFAKLVEGTWKIESRDARGIVY